MNRPPGLLQPAGRGGLVAGRIHASRRNIDVVLMPPVVTTEFWNVTKKPTSLMPFQTKFVPPAAAKPIGDQLSVTHGQVKGPCTAESQMTVRSRKDPIVLPVGEGNETGTESGWAGGRGP